MDYPISQDWDNKVFSMPNLPRGDMGSIGVLRRILTMVENGHPKETKLSFSGSNSSISLDDACVRLRSMRLVEKSADRWTLPPASKKWLESEDNLYLAAILCANVRFLAEILFYLDVPRTAAQLQEIAVSEYNLNWKTYSPLNSRLIWLRQLGLVSFQHFSLHYFLTDAGKEFLETVQVVNPSDVLQRFDETAGEKTIYVEDWAVEYCKREGPIVKKVALGYFPGNMAEIDRTLSSFLKLIRNGASYEAIKTFAAQEYGIATSSVKSFMSNLVNMDFVVRVTDSSFEITDLAEYWLQRESLVDLAVCLQNSHLFMFELLHELKSEPMTYKELAIKAKVSYSFEKESIEEIRKRVSIFKAAKLVMNVSADKYALTNRGRILLETFVDLPVSVPAEIAAVQKREDINSLISELRLASRESSNPARFEKSIKHSFEAIGFAAKLLGGSGKTDVLLTVPGSSQYSFTVVVDAKSTASASVGEGLIDFDTLKEHKRKHKADFIAIVGCAFQNDRLIKRAVEHKVALIDVDTLEELIKKHNEVPLLLTAYKNVFEQCGIVNIKVLEEERNKVAHSGVLMQAVMDCMLKEDKDKVTNGLLHERDVYRSLRDNGTFVSGIELNEISDMLALLSSPPIGCLGKEKDHFYAIGAAEDAARKFAFFAQMCQKN